MRANKSRQQTFFKKSASAFGGDHYKKRAGRGVRPLAVKHSMHLVLRSTQAVKEKSFKRFEKKIEGTLQKYADKNHIKILSFANVGNHIHAHIQLSSRQGYRAFIRAVTGAIALMVGGRNLIKKFFDRRPFTRIVASFSEFKTMQEYLQVNQLEGMGVTRGEARMMIEDAKRARRRRQKTKGQHR